MAGDSTNIWNYREALAADRDASDRDLAGFDVEATDGSIGKIDATSTQTDNAHIVVDTGFWIFGKKRLIPAGTITGVDYEHETVSIGLTKDQVKDAPDFEAERSEDPSDHVHRSNYNEYYGPHGW